MCIGTLASSTLVKCLNSLDIRLALYLTGYKGQSTTTTLYIKIKNKITLILLFVQDSTNSWRYFFKDIQKNFYDEFGYLYVVVSYAHVADKLI